MDRMVHRDAAGDPVFSYVAGDDDGRPAAYDLRPAGAPDRAETVAATVLTELPGWVVSSSGAVGEVLVRRGARMRRRFGIMRRALDGSAPPPAWRDDDLGGGHRAVPADRDLDDLGSGWYAAYSRPGHPDAPPGAQEQAVRERLGPLLAGADGPLLACSRLAVDPDDRVVAGALVIDAPGVGALLAEVFRTPGPERAGLGAALLRRVLAAAADDGVPALVLSVSAGNPADRVYRRLGFRPVSTLVTVVLPER